MLLSLYFNVWICLISKAGTELRKDGKDGKRWAGTQDPTAHRKWLEQGYGNTFVLKCLQGQIFK